MMCLTLRSLTLCTLIIGVLVAPAAENDGIVKLPRAAEQGLAQAQVNPGLMYAEGKGIPQDYIAAPTFLNLAGAKGNEKVNYDPREARDRFASKMTAAQIAEAQHRAREWKPEMES